ncbi:MAG: ParA family protein [Acidimicrobiia bacterium]
MRIAVTNQKGGVAKTTTTYTLAAAYAEQGKSVLSVDLDPQASLTFSTGIDPDHLSKSLHDVMIGTAPIESVIVSVNGFDLVPSCIDLAGAEVHLLTRTGREHALARALRDVSDNYDVVLIDCPPSLGILTINGLTAAESIIVPLQCETLSHRGVGQLLDTIDDVRAFTNPDLRVLGIVPTMFDQRTKHSREILEDVQERYGLHVFSPAVPKSVRFAEAPGLGKTILEYASKSKGAIAYRELATAIWSAAHE